MTTPETASEQLLAGDPRAIERLAAAPLVIRKDNLVPRPWGGNKIIEFKELETPGGFGGEPVGESFEIAADDRDAEACRYPSQIALSDGSMISLPRLLESAGDKLLGSEFVARYGHRFPLLPKLLNIRELLSVQGHPAGNTEVYVIIAAEPGATLRLGFRRDMDGPAMTERLQRGRAEQAKLLAALGPEPDLTALQGTLAPQFASGTMDAAALAHELTASAEACGSTTDVQRSLEILNETYWWMLDAMNAIPVVPGQVIHNRNPARLVPVGAEPSAEVHALGNPEGKEVLALEIRKPGPTFRAWDNVRFPVRQVDVPAAVAALNLRATQPAEFIVEPRPVAGRPGAILSVESEYFRIEHLSPRADRDVLVEQHGVHCLHGLAGAAVLIGPSDEDLGTIAVGQSLVIPAPMVSYKLKSRHSDTEIIKVNLPG